MIRKVLLTFCFGSALFILLMCSFSSQKSVDTKVELGEKLFFDPILSSDKSVSCASCHKPEFAFADNVAFSVGVENKTGTRNAPSVMNMASREELFWDGRAASLETQVIGPIENPVEMNLPFSEAVQRIQHSVEYKNLFQKIYKHLPDSVSIIDAIASFERSLETDQTPSDRWLHDEPNGMTEQQIRGRDIFLSDKTKCFDCHFTPDFTSDEFKNIGIFDGKTYNDSGRYNVTKKLEDIGKFKIPGLRNVAVTAPYMHNGMFKTLREVINYYDNPSAIIPHSINKDTTLPAKIGLTELEKDDLEAYLNALTDDRFAIPLKK